VTLAYFLFASDTPPDSSGSDDTRFHTYDLPNRAALSAEDAALLARLRGDDEHDALHAFATVFDAHYSAAYDYALRMLRNDAEAEDLVQDVFERLLERRTQLDITTSVRGYILRAVRGEALHTLRHARVVTKYEGEIASTARDREMTFPVDEALAASELRQVVEAAVEKLPGRCREAFALRWRYELSYAEIADAMQISVKTVEMQLTRAMKAVRAAVARYLSDGHTG
jgi:RNA polymerase sigma-70 factor (ECF subfamily)